MTKKQTNISDVVMCHPQSQTDDQVISYVWTVRAVRILLLENALPYTNPPTDLRRRSRRWRRQRHRRKIIPIARAPTPIAHPLILQLQNLRRQGRDDRIILLHDRLTPPLEPALSLPIVRVRRHRHQVPKIEAVARVTTAPARAVERLRRHGDDDVCVCWGTAGRAAASLAVEDCGGGADGEVGRGRGEGERVDDGGVGFGRAGGFGEDCGAVLGAEIPRCGGDGPVVEGLFEACVDEAVGGVEAAGDVG